MEKIKVKKEFKKFYGKCRKIKGLQTDYIIDNFKTALNQDLRSKEGKTTFLNCCWNIQSEDTITEKIYRKFDYFIAHFLYR